MSIIARPSRRVAVVAAGVFALLLVGCGSSKSSGSTTTTMPATTTTVKATTTTAGSGSTATITPTPPPPSEDPWTVSPRDLSTVIGKRYAFVCPAGGTVAASVWGVGVYTNDSGICDAAVHAGIITMAKGGTVTFDVLPGRDSYSASNANGIESLDYGSWDQSFQFVK